MNTRHGTEIGYENKRVIVTGCASGIGHATARLLRQLGAQVHGLDLKVPDLDLAFFNITDLAVPESIDAALAHIGKVDALFNCAGLPPTHPPLNIITVNFLGTRYLTESVLRHMENPGAIVSTASNGGAAWPRHLPALLELVDETNFTTGLRWAENKMSDFQSAYSLSKEAIIVWTMRQSATLIKRGIRINCISPGAVQTPMLEELEMKISRSAIDNVVQPIGRRSEADEQAWPLVFLNSKAASYINGIDLPVDGGFAANLLLQSS